MTLRQSPNTLRGNRCEFDFVSETELRCLSHRDHSIRLMIPAGRAVTLRTLRDRGELRGRALEEASR